MWVTDSKINEANLDKEALRCGELHQKYYSYLYRAKIKLKVLENELGKMETLKWLYYTGDMPEEDLKELGWEPFDMRILRSDVDKFIKADEELIDQRLKIAVVKEKIIFLESIIKMLQQRSFDIRNCVEYKKFEAGI